MIGISEILVLALGFALCFLVGKFGEDTKLSFWGSFVLSVLTTPFVAFLLILLFFKRK